MVGPIQRTPPRNVSTSAPAPAASTTPQVGTAPSEEAAAPRAEVEAPPEGPRDTSAEGWTRQAMDPTALGLQGRLNAALPPASQARQVRPADSPDSAALAAAPALAATHRDIPTNVAAIRGSVGERGRNDPADVQLVQRRLCQLKLLDAGQVTGTYDDATRDALRRFQSDHAADIDQVRRDCADPAFPEQVRGERSVPGRVEPHDATHQALANAWPRTIQGRLMSETQAYEYLSTQVRERTGSFDPERVHVVGVRGFQGGAAHANPGVRRRDNQYNDEFFVLARGADGTPHVRSYVGTTDPGAASSVTDANRGHIPVLEADQQIPYRHGVGAVRFGTAGSGPRGDLRVEQDGRSVERRGAGIAMHSGAETPSGVVFADSQGCQVVHGSWYPAFQQEVGRALDAERQRARDGGRELGHAPEDYLYSILDGRDLASPR